NPTVRPRLALLKGRRKPESHQWDCANSTSRAPPTSSPANPLNHESLCSSTRPEQEQSRNPAKTRTKFDPPSADIACSEFLGRFAAGGLGSGTAWSAQDKRAAEIKGKSPQLKTFE